MVNSKFQRILYDRFFNEKGDKTYTRLLKFKVKAILDLVEENPTGRFLDVGCASGVITQYIKEKTKSETYGIDISEDALKLAEERGITVKHGDIDGKRLPFDDDYFDGVLCSDIIEHLLATDMFVGELQRIVKPDGYIIVSVPNAASWYNRLLLLAGILPPFLIDSTEKDPIRKLFNIPIEALGHVRGFTKRCIVNLLKKHRFVAVNIKPTTLSDFEAVILEHFQDKKTYTNWTKHLIHALSHIETLISRNFVSLASIILIKAKQNPN